MGMLWSVVYLYKCISVGIMKKHVPHVLHGYALACCVPVQCISVGIMKGLYLIFLKGMLWSAVYLYSVFRLGIMKRPIPHILHGYALVRCVPVQCISVRYYEEACTSYS